jgi:TetR/AcrR family transcriptional repressor of nem operon
MKSTKSALLEHAEFLIRTKGFSALSYNELANEFGITKAAIHYHFPTKENLAIVLISDYINKFSKTLHSIEVEQNCIRDKLIAYSTIFTQGHDKSVLPLCCAMAAQRTTLPLALRELSKQLFVIQLNWLTKIIEEAVHLDEGINIHSSQSTAMFYLSVLEGASLISWVFNDKSPIITAFNNALEKNFPE